MAENNQNSTSRRKFLSLGLLTGAGMVTGKLNAQAAIESGETVKMLTQDGKVVEVDKAMLPGADQHKQASKKDVLHWIHPEK
jgi:hypothetical protein